MGPSSSGLSSDVEEEGLTYYRAQGISLERLADEKGRFGFGAGQEPLGKSRHENDRHRHTGQNSVYGVQAGTSVSELYVGKDETRPKLMRSFDGLALCPRYANDVVAQVLDQPLQVHRDQGFILDAQHIGFDLCGQVLVCVLE